MKIVFMGTPDFAVPSLEILTLNHEVSLVVTQPDRKKGRGKKMLAPIIKEVALEKNIPVLQPEKVREEQFIAELKKHEPDLIVVVAFGQILPKEILDMPKFACVNLHGSLLPEYRGAAPIQWSIINGDKVTGVTTMFMAEGLDSGDMILKKEIEIVENENYGTLKDKMSEIGAELLLDTVKLFEKGDVKREVQDHSKMTLAPRITKEHEKICWNKNALEVLNMINGLNPEPGAYTTIEVDSEILKIYSAKIQEGDFSNYNVGEIVLIEKKGFAVKCFKDALYVTEIQARGGKKMDAGSYLRGHSLNLGDKFLV